MILLYEMLIIKQKVMLKSYGIVFKMVHRAGRLTGDVLSIFANFLVCGHTATTTAATDDCQRNGTLESDDKGIEEHHDASVGKEHRQNHQSRRRSEASAASTVATTSLERWLISMNDMPAPCQSRTLHFLSKQEIHLRRLHTAQLRRLISSSLIIYEFLFML